MSAAPSYQEIVQRLQDLSDAIVQGYLVVVGIIVVMVVAYVWADRWRVVKSKEKER